MNPIDSSIIHFVNQFANRWKQFDLFMVILLDANILKGGVLLTLIWWFWTRETEDAPRTRQLLLATIVGAFAAMAIARGISLFVHLRPRPFNDPSLLFSLPFGMKPRDQTDWSAFPSDHAALFLALSSGFFFLSRRLGVAVILYAIVAILLPRLYLGMHYPTDLLAGSFIGCASTYVATRPPICAWVATPGIRWAAKHPPSFYAVLFLLSYQMVTLFIDVRILGSHGFDLLSKLLHLGH